MNDFTVEVDRAVPLQNSLVITAFPTIGNVASTVVRYLTEVTNVKHVGGFYSPRYPPIASVHAGSVDLPVEVHAGSYVCGMQDEFDHLVVVTSDVPVPDPLAHDLAVAILDWSREVGSGEIVALEGLRVTDGGETRVHGLGSTGDVKRRLEANDVPLLQEGLIGGVTSVLLHRAKSWGLSVYGLLVRASAEGPDASAAAELLRAANRVIVHEALDEANLDADMARVSGNLSKRQEAARPLRRTDVAYT
jgi:predicted ATP-grasp superfamily ATP-dependent carboligase